MKGGFAIGCFLTGLVSLAMWSGAGAWPERKPGPRCRIAVLNSTLVLLRYEKYKRFSEELGRIASETHPSTEATRNAAYQRSEEQLQELYLDIAKAAAHVAKERGFDLVLHYPDETLINQGYSARSIARKNVVGLMPMYIAPGLDISQEVIAQLNKRSP